MKSLAIILVVIATAMVVSKLFGTWVVGVIAVCALTLAWGFFYGFVFAVIRWMWRHRDD